MSERLQTLTLSWGAHESREQGMNALEAAAWLAGEPHSDAPRCVSPVIASILREWDDYSADDDETYTRLFRPLVPLIVDTWTNGWDDADRLVLILDWLVREYTPAWLDLVPSLHEHAAALRALPVFTRLQLTDATQNVLARAGAAAVEASSDRDEDETSAAAWLSGGGAAWEAWRRNAWGDDDDRAAVWQPALDSIAAAVTLASPDVLQATVTTLQASACDLIRRLCAVGRAEAAASQEPRR